MTATQRTAIGIVAVSILVGFAMVGSAAVEFFGVAVRSSVPKPDVVAAIAAGNSANRAIAEADRLRKDLERLNADLRAERSRSRKLKTEIERIEAANDDRGAASGQAMAEGHRSCAGKAGGQIDFVFEMAVTDDRIEVRRRQLSNPDMQSKILSLSGNHAIDMSSGFSADDFEAWADPYRQFAAERGCRLFVLLRDETTKLGAYRSGRLLVERYFYKLEV